VVKLSFLSNRIAPLITLPGSGWLIWYAVLVCVGLFIAFASAVPTTFFFLGLMWPLTVMIVITIFVIPPVCAIVKSVMNLLRRRYQSAIAFGLVPLIGFGVFALSSMLFISVATKAKIAFYRSRIETAVVSGSSVSEKNVVIDLGPPIVARFVQPTMMWEFWEIVYVEDDDVSRFDEPLPFCKRSIQALGGHYYSVRGTC